MVVITEERGVRGVKKERIGCQTARLVSSYKIGSKHPHTHGWGAGTQGQEGRRLQPEVWGGHGGSGPPPPVAEALDRGWEVAGSCVCSSGGPCKAKTNRKWAPRT